MLRMLRRVLRGKRLITPEGKSEEVKEAQTGLGGVDDKKTQSIITLKSVKKNLLINRFLNSNLKLILLYRFFASFMAIIT